MRRPNNSTIWDAPIALRATPGVAEKAVDLAVDSTGLLHFVWVDKRSGTHVYYGRMDPTGPQILEEVQVTANADNFQRATLVLDRDDRPYLLFDSEDNLTNSGDIWFVAPLAPSSVRDWNDYE
jgi:hypothetical protein